MTEPSIASGVVRGLYEFALARGAPPAELLSRAGLDLTQLQDEERRLPLSTYHALLLAGQTLCGDEALALHFGEAVGSAELSLVGLIGQAASTLGEAFVQLNRYTRLVVEGEGFGGEQRFKLDATAEGHWLVDTRSPQASLPASTEGNFARIVTEMRRLTARPLVRAVHFMHAAPRYRAECERVFGVPVGFDRERNALLLDPAWAEQPVALTPRYAFAILTAHADRLLHALDTPRDWRSRVEAALLPRLHTGPLTLEDAARTLAVGRTTLYRRLKAEGISFNELLQSLRHRMAQQYLAAGRVSVKEVAYLVGFSDAAAFSRAYKRRAGVPPSLALAGNGSAGEGRGQLKT